MSSPQDPTFIEAAYLQRFWQPVVRPVQDDAAGDTRTELRRERVALHAVADTPCLILLGDAGMGKTTEIEHLAAALRGEGALVDVVLGRDPELPGTLEQLLTSKHHSLWSIEGRPWHILIDGIDEIPVAATSVAQRIGAFFDRLLASARNIASLHIMLTSRKAAWTPEMAHVVEQRWPMGAFETLDLAPLDADQVRTAIDRLGLDPGGAAWLADQLLGGSLVAMATRPLLLKLLLDLYQADQVPPRQTDLVKLAVEGALRMTLDPSSPATLDQLVTVAARMATAASFSQQVRLTTAFASSARDMVSMPQLAGGSEASSVGTFVVTPQLMAQCLRSSLFTEVAPGTFEWTHRQFVEYLTARYLAEHGLSPDQLLSLLMVREVGGPGGIAPQFRYVAGWIAGMVPAFFDRLVEQEPDILLEADMAAAEPADRARLTEVLLARFAAGALLDRYEQIRPLLGRLAHPGLAGQLKPVLGDRRAGAALQRFALDVAMAAGLTELLPAVLALALDVDSLALTRALAVRAVARLGDAQSRAALVPILSGDLASDRDDNLRGVVLDVCWPDTLPFRTLLTTLTLPKQPHFLGPYAFFLHRFEPPELSPEMALEALSWLRLRFDLDDEDNRRLQRVVVRMFSAVAARTDVPAVRDAMADLIVSADTRLSGIAGADRRTMAGWPPDADDRIALVIAVLERSPSPQRATNAMLYFLPGLIEPEDLDAYLAALARADEQAIAGALAELIGYLSERRPIDTLDALWDAADQNPALQDILRQRFTVDLDSVAAEQMRKRAAQDREAALHEAQLESTASQRQAMIRDLLDRIETDEPDLWWQLNLQLFHSASGHYEAEFEFRSDLTAAPGWQLLGNAERDRIRRTAPRYLMDAPLQDISWLGSNTGHRPAAAGLRALRLLLDGAPDAFDALPVETWRAWGPVTIGFFENDFHSDGTTQRRLVREAYQHAPDTIIAAIRQIALDPRSEGLTARIFDRLEEIVDPALAALLLDLRADPGLRGSTAASDIVSFLVRTGDPVATREVVAALRSPADALAGRGDAAIAALAAAAAQLMLAAPADTWLPLLELRGRSDDFARSVWSAFAAAWSFSQRDTLQGLSEYALAQAYLDLEALLPERPSQETGARTIGMPDYVEQLRSALLTQLIEAGTNASLEQLTRLELTLPNGRDLLRWSIERARRVVRAASTRPQDPAEVLAEIGAMRPVPADPPSTPMPTAPVQEAVKEMAPGLEVPIPAPRPQGLLPPEQRRSILAVATEWSSAHGGISTLNRELCAALAALGHAVACLVIDASEAEILQAKTRLVDLVASPSSVGITDDRTFLLCDAQTLPRTPDLVIGHDHITGSYGRALATRFGAKYVHLLHTIPQENEGLKSARPDRARGVLDGEAKMKQQVALGLESDLVVAVGPRIRRNFRSAALDAQHVTMLLPGLDMVLLARSPDLALLHVNQCLLSGRMEDAGVKGAVLGCEVMRAVVTGRAWPNRERPQLVIRGFSEGQADAEFAAIGVFSEYSRFVQTRAFSTDARDLLDDYRRSAVVIMPSIAEGFGLTGLEAIAAGVPVVLSKESGLAEYLLDPQLNEGLDLSLVEPCVGPVMEDDEANCADWAGKVGTALANHSAAFARAAQLRSALATRLTWDRAARQLTADFQTL